MDTVSETSAGRLLALGDSYTIGESVLAAERWPMQLAAALRQQFGLTIEPQVVAKTGWTADELLAAIDQTQLQPPYDLVSLQIGVNNQYRGGSVAEFLDDFHRLLRLASALSGDRSDRVFVLSIPDWGVMPFAAGDRRSPEQIRAEINEYNRASERLCRQLHVRYFDITEISREQPSLVADDGLHPSGAQYAWWMFSVVDAVAAILRAKSSSDTGRS